VTNVVPVHSKMPASLGQIAPSATAEITCAQRAAETLAPAGKRLIEDRYGRYFLRSRSFRLLCSNRLTAAVTRTVFDRRYPGFMAIVLLRNRWYEEVLASAVADGIDQIVLLGAGYDTTSLRLPLGAAMLFEVDAPPTQRAKREAVARHGLAVPDAVRYVPCDFERDVLPTVLTAHGFDPSRRSLIVWYGVSFFLSEQAVEQTLRDVTELSAPGSRFLFDYLDTSVVDGTTQLRGALRARSAVARRGEAYTYGLSRAGADRVLRRYGFRTVANLSVTDLASRYGGPNRVWCSTDDFFGVITGELAS
jgi:methyltransferase (TIGR00027 family)